MHAAYFVKRRNRLRCFIVTGALAHECGCVKRGYMSCMSLVTFIFFIWRKVKIFLISV